MNGYEHPLPPLMNFPFLLFFFSFSLLGCSFGSRLFFAPMSVSHQLSEEERQEFREIFNLVDENGGGTIDKDELRKLMNTIGLHPSPDELDKMFDDVDEDGSGEIDFDEFLAVMSRKVEASYTAQQLEDAFKIFETPDGPPGFVKTEVLKRALCTYGVDKMTEDEAVELLRTVDPDRRGVVNYREYIQLLSK